jgi:hypothetical protein
MSCHCKSSANFPSLSNLGSGQSANLKTCDIQSKGDQTELDLTDLRCFASQNNPSWMAGANALRIFVHCDGEKWSRKGADAVGCV